MLMQRAAAEYVHRLTAAANAEHAFARRVERFPQQTVGQIARGVVALDRWMRLLAEQLCGQVTAARKNQRVERRGLQRCLRFRFH